MGFGVFKGFRVCALEIQSLGFRFRFSLNPLLSFSLCCFYDEAEREAERKENVLRNLPGSRFRVQGSQTLRG